VSWDFHVVGCSELPSPAWRMAWLGPPSRKSAVSPAASHSNATSAGAYRTAAAYLGAHGHSIRLDGLDPTNSNAAARAIVVHGAWYVSEEIIGRCGMLGRSEGCLAVSHSSLDEVLTRLGPGRLIYAGKA